MSIKMREEVERKIAAAVIDGALAAGYSITVFDGEDETVKRSKDKDEILKAMYTTDEDYLFIYEAPAPDKKIGWVRFVYGNDGYDVVNDYTTNLDSMMAKANEIAEYYSD